VDAFVAALSKAGWHQPRAATLQPADGVTVQDHDDPTTPLQVVEGR
jgi:hypothetical protein